MTGETMTTQDVSRFRAFLVYLRDEEGFDGIDAVLRQLDARTAMNEPAPQLPAALDTTGVSVRRGVDTDRASDTLLDGGDSRMSGRDPLYTPDIVDLALRIARIGSAIGAAAIAAALLIRHFWH
jgi:hypothetical protein